MMYQDWNLNEQTISGHETIINLKPAIDAELDRQKQEQANKSYDKKNLSNRASTWQPRFFHKEIIGN